MSTTNVMLAKTWDPSIDPTGWWMSEKKDGIRALWESRQLVSRLDNVFSSPAYFTSSFPRVTLDGELWAGRGNLPECVSIVESERIDKGWDKLTYNVFDLPDMRAPFEERYAALREVATGVPYLSIVKQVRCVSMLHLTTELKRVVSIGGEGLVLRQPGSYYERKRSSTMLKVITHHTTEARVIGYTAGEGKHRGRVGALKLRLKSGVEFKAGTGLSNYDREHPPRIGSLVTIRYKMLTRDGVPRDPRYVTERDYE